MLPLGGRAYGSAIVGAFRLYRTPATGRECGMPIVLICVALDGRRASVLQRACLLRSPWSPVLIVCIIVCHRVGCGRQRQSPSVLKTDDWERVRLKTRSTVNGQQRTFCSSVPIDTGTGVHCTD